VRRPLALAAAVLLALTGCRGKGDGGSVPDPKDRAAATVDWSRPDRALLVDGDAAAARLGSFSWEADASWTVSRGPGSRTVSVSERHRVRQLAGGEFEAESEIDPGTGPGSETGRSVVWADGSTFARSRHMPYRARPTDRGRDARRFRDESFRLVADLAALYGPALRLRAAGEATALGRPARRFTLSFDPALRAAAQAPPPGRSTDADTRSRVELLEDAVPVALDGELVVDERTGVPLRARIHAAFGVPSDPLLRADVKVDARLTALGAGVAAVRAPQGALPDERKPNGPARALEAAGLRERGRPAGGEPEPEDEPGE
jgi:hypothetical protein